MNLDKLMPDLHARMTAIRRDLHAHPEMAFKEQRTSGLVAEWLVALGIETHRGIAGTGVVGKLSFGSGQGRTIGLRTDMDALLLGELNTFAHRSVNPGCMHACGHDGHTAMLLGAAEVLAKLRQQDAGQLDGTVYFIFQPAEEHEGGARLMVKEGLFERFPMDAVFGLHNWPGLPVGQIAIISGPVMAGADRFDIVVTGRGGHAAMPHKSTDSIIAATALVQALQTLVSRNTEPLEPAVLSVTRIHAGHTDNVLPEETVLGGTVRAFSAKQQTLMENGMQRICDGIAATYGVRVDMAYNRGYPPTINSEQESALCHEVAAQVMGKDNIRTDLRPSMGAEDFAYLLRERPGCYSWLGNDCTANVAKSDCILHGPYFDFNDEIIPLGIRYWVALVEQSLARR